jgi:hypothetical protein
VERDEKKFPQLTDEGKYLLLELGKSRFGGNVVWLRNTDRFF